MTMQIWDVSGSFVCPGTRDKVHFGPVRVSAESRQAASRDLAPLLQKKFGKEAKHQDGRPYIFSVHFAMYHLQWAEFKPKQHVAPPVDLSALNAPELISEDRLVTP